MSLNSSTLFNHTYTVFMTIGEVVDYLKVTERTIYRLAQYHGVLGAARRLHDEHLSVDPPNSFEMPSKQQVTHQG
jgi:hypothetical protein